jgi:hypothetical protein
MPPSTAHRALTRHELRELWQRAPSQEVRVLLWEIKRLQLANERLEKIYRELDTFAISLSVRKELFDMQLQLRWNDVQRLIDAERSINARC